MKIIADHREKYVIKEFARRKIEYESKQLVIADFVIGDIGIERKTQNDFINSIIDKRLMEQIIVLKENFKIPLLIVEGDENMYEIRNFHPNAIRGMFASIALDYQIPIIHTKNYKDTVAFLEVILNRIKKGQKPISLLKKRKPLSLKQQQELLIESLPGIGPTLSKSLLKEFGNVKSIINANDEVLESIDKIGPKKSKKIKEILESEYK